MLRCFCAVYSAQVRAQNAGFVYVTNSQGSNGTGTPAILGFAVNPISSVTSGYFAPSGADNPPLHTLGNTASTPDGPYCYGSTSCFPANTYHSANCWVDVLFQHEAQLLC